MDLSVDEILDIETRNEERRALRAEVSKGQWTYESFAWLEVDSRPYKDRCCLLIRRWSWFEKLLKKYGNRILDEGTTAGSRKNALQPARDGLYLKSVLNDCTEDEITKLLSEIRRLRTDIPPPTVNEGTPLTRRTKRKPRNGRALPYGSRKNDKPIYDTEWEFREWFEDNLEFFGFKRIIHSQEVCPDYIVETKSGEVLRVEAELFAANFIAHGHDPSNVDRIVACFSAEHRISGVPVLTANDLRLYPPETSSPKKKADFGVDLSDDERHILGIVMSTGGIELSALAQHGFAGNIFLFHRVSPELIKGIKGKRIQDSLLQIIGRRTRDYIRKFHHVLLGGGLSDGLCKALDALQKRGLIALRPLPLMFAMYDGILIDHDGWVPTEVYATDNARASYAVHYNGQLTTKKGA